MPLPSTDSNSSVTPMSENPPLPPHLATSDTIATGHASLLQPMTEFRSSNGVADRLSGKIPDFHDFRVLDSNEHTHRFRREGSEYVQILMKRYFSGKNIFEGSIFEERTMIGEETIMSSRWPCTLWYAHPIQCLNELNIKDSALFGEKPQ